VALMAFARVIELIQQHRQDIGVLRSAMRSSLARVERLVNKRLADGRALSLKEEALVMGILRDYANALARVMPLERRAFGFTDEDGPSEMDGFTPEELDAVEQTVRKALGR
jgi:hypothetical protein